MCSPFIGAGILSKILFTRHTWPCHRQIPRVIFLTNALIALESSIEKAMITGYGAAVIHKTRATAPRSPLHEPQISESSRDRTEAPFHPYQNATNHHSSKITILQKSQICRIKGKRNGLQNWSIFADFESVHLDVSFGIYCVGELARRALHPCSETHE